MTIHIGLIGGGNISDTHARAARAISGVNSAAIYGTNSDKVSRLSLEHGAKAYGDFDDFLRHRPMDIVTVGSPSGLHATHGIAAAERGLHVLTEKPIEISSGRAAELIEVARRSGVKLGVMFQDRGKPEIRKLKQWVDLGSSEETSSHRCEGKVVPFARILCAIEVARHTRLRWRRSSYQAGDPYDRPLATVIR